MKNSFLYFLSKYLNTHLPLTVGASSNTIKAYSDTFKLFFLFAKEKYNLNPKKIEFETIDKKFVIEFSTWISKTRKSSESTKNLRLKNRMPQVISKTAKGLENFGRYSTKYPASAATAKLANVMSRHGNCRI